MAKPRRKRAIHLLLGIGSTLLSLALALSVFFRLQIEGGVRLVSRFPLREFAGDLPRYAVPTIVFIVFTGLALPLRALQWQSTLMRPVPFRERYHLVAIASFVQNVLPGKLGDVTRAFLLARKEKMPFVETLGSVAVGRLFELAVMMLISAALLLGPMAGALPAFARGLKVASAACAGLVVLVLLLAWSSERLSRLASRWHWRKLETFFVHVSAGLGATRSPKKLALAVLLAVGPVAASSIAFGFFLSSIRARGGLMAGFVVLAAMTIGQSTLGVPAAVGTSFVVANWSSQVLGASAQDAAAFATLTSVGTAAAHIVLGIISLLAGEVRWSDLKRQRQEIASRARDAETSSAALL